MLFGGILAFLAGVQFVAAQNNACPSESRRSRKEWRTLSDDEKRDYLNAVKCLQSRPPKGQQFFDVRSRFDDFVALHINATGLAILDQNGGFVNLTGPTPGVHFNGIFLPWHRYLVWSYEQALRDECGYRGGQPYWDMSIDSRDEGGAWGSSPVWDPNTGFGGNGFRGTEVFVQPGFRGAPQGIAGPPLGSCVRNGPFAESQFKLHLDAGPPEVFQDLPTSERCLFREWQPALVDAAFGWQRNIVPLLNQRTFAAFSAGYDADVGKTGSPGIHAAGHFGIGGEMLNVWSSSNDPLFYMHHANLDRIWWLWQRSSESNLYDIGGPIWSNGTGTVNLDTAIEMGRYTAPAVPARALMDIRNRDGRGILCYRYEESELLSADEQRPVSRAQYMEYIKANTGGSKPPTRRPRRFMS